MSTAFFNPESLPTIRADLMVTRFKLRVGEPNAADLADVVAQDIVQRTGFI
jgi:hypothetical protein